MWVCGVTWEVVECEEVKSELELHLKISIRRVFDSWGSGITWGMVGR